MTKLVIVESPTKAKTIAKFLGKGFVVESSFGHLRDLPKSKMGIDTTGGTFEPTYVIPEDRKAQVLKLKKLAKNSEIIFATDEDREGEAISWHLAHIFDVNPADAKRIAFHEITKTAIDEALKNPRAIDQKLVDAQQARRILDRLVGYELSPLLWKKIARGLSAGRVQSVAVRLVVEREEEIKKFQTEEYWTLGALFANSKQEQFTGKLNVIANKKLNQNDINNKEQIDEILNNLKGVEYIIGKIHKRSAKSIPPPPFTTSTLQQTSNQKLGYSAKQTMRLAQQLYEGMSIGAEGSVGLITYMRTDSLNLSEKFVNEAINFIKNKFGANYGLDKPRFYKNKSKNAQEAHEAIRPTDPNRTPESVEQYLSPQQHKLYRLIWKRTLATQIATAELDKTSITINAKQYTFKANGQTIIFPGWLTLYPDAVKEDALPILELNEKVDCLELKPEQHFTEPPARYSDATLVKVMEEYGIGRPSTYAPTIATIEARGYVERDEHKRLKPKDIAFVVNDLLMKNFPDIVDYKFTAVMENNLDDIALGKKDWQPIIATFYQPFHENVMEKTESLNKQDTTGMRELGIDPESSKKIFVRIGRFGPYVQKGESTDEDKPKFASLAKGQTMDTVNLEQSLVLFTLPKELGTDEEGHKIVVNIGRFGPYVQVDKKYYSLKEKDPYTLNLEEALEVIKNAKEVEKNKKIKEFPNSSVQILNGRYGIYITNGEKNAKIPADKKPEDLTLEECEELIKNYVPKRKTYRKKK